MAKTMRAKKRGAAEWCEANGIRLGDRIERLYPDGWVPVVVTALGQSAILTRRKGASENAAQEPTKFRLILKPAPSICANCGKPGPHFVPPSFGEPGFFACGAAALEGE